MNVNLSKIEIDILIELLDRASSIFSNFSCNDITLENCFDTLTTIPITPSWETTPISGRIPTSLPLFRVKKLCCLFTV